MATLAKYSVPFQGYVFQGTFADIYAAAEGSFSGSGTSFALAVDKSGAVLTFTDNASANQSLVPGDAIEAVMVSGAFTGYAKVASNAVALWVLTK